MNLAIAPSAFITLDATLVTALERECRSHGQRKNVPLWAKLEADMRSYYEFRKACVPGQMILCRMLETIQAVDADHEITTADL